MSQIAALYSTQFKNDDVVFMQNLLKSGVTMRALLYGAIVNNSSKIAKMIIEDSECKELFINRECIFYAVKNKSSDILKMMIEVGGDVPFIERLKKLYP